MMRYGGFVVRTWVAGCVVLMATAALSQAKVAAPLAYDAVSIKPNHSGTGMIRVQSSPDGTRFEGMSLKQLLVNAYGIREGLITGLPGWAESARFDVQVKIVDADPEVMKKITPEQRRTMLAAVLEDRFHLKVHTEVKTLPVYELVVAKDGPKFKESTALPFDATADLAARRKMAGNMSMGPGMLTATGGSISVLTGGLEGTLDRTVVDKTGLTGKYDLHLKWLPDNAPPPMVNGGPDPDPPPPLFTAIQEQLGLKLVAGKGPVTTLVVDKVEEATEN